MGLQSREEVVQSMQDAAERMGLDLDDLQEMIVAVLEDCSKKSKLLKEAVTSKNTADIKAIAHDIKGSTANYGLGEATAIALSIEKSAENFPEELVNRLIEQFNHLSGLELDKTS